MDPLKEKLISCFLAVMPDLSADDVPQASAGNASNWDSVTTVSLIAVVEEEFGISIESDDLSHFDSFESILGYLKKRAAQGSLNETVV